ncbi:TVP38/TMEM64 family protein [Sutcliffiella horikoshii]|uniref:TVP38/TMEM64 family membrane protein n=1 Tax=Sutcliffiella horikoshii TaxID=79883 RepID=A0AA94WIM2_9BACI|nr:TVP38/TMEM64 family protein [Sutcliffiella horikoshii]TYS54412.1 TVP38/TMEM64 family protein [Sutcliffiella horikoshii]
MTKKNWIKGVLLAILVGSLIFINHNYLNIRPEGIREWILSFGILAPVIYIVLYTIRPLILFPASILSLAAGLAFGALWGTVYTILGATLGAVVAFLVAKKFGKNITKNKPSNVRVKKVQSQMEVNGFFYVLLLRLIPLFNFDLISYLAGLSKVKLSHFVLATVIGIIPGTFAYNFLGSSFVGDNKSIIIFAVVVFILISVLPLILSKKVRSKLGFAKTEEKR